MDAEGNVPADQLRELKRLASRMNNFWRTAQVLCVQATENLSPQQVEEVTTLAADLSERFIGHRRSVVATVLYLALFAHLQKSLEVKALAEGVLSTPLTSDWERIRAFVADSTRDQEDVATIDEVESGVATIGKILTAQDENIVLPVFLLLLLDNTNRGGELFSAASL
jgi:hypothetical protein